MKTIITTALLIGLLFTSSVAISATNNASIAKNAKENVRREIIRNISCPEFIDNNNPTNQVKAVVEVDEKGKVKVDEINSANPQLRAYVINQLQNMQVKSTGQSQKFVLVINFQVG